MKADFIGLIQQKMRKNMHDTVLWILLVVLVISLSFLSDKFLTLRNFQAMALQFAPLCVFTLGMMIPLIVGGINLGLIAIGNSACVVMAVSYFQWTGRGEPLSELAMLGYVAMVLLIGSGFGLVAGYLVGYLKVPAMLATLAVQMICNGISLILTKNVGISGFAENFLALSTRIVLGMPLCLWIAIGFALVSSVMLGRKILGFRFKMVGSNDKASEFSGIDVRRTKLYAYVFSGLCSSLGALLMTLQYNSANVNQGDSYILKTVLVCVLGGVSPQGGFGKVFGVLLGLVMLQFISSGLNIAGVTAYVQTSLWGAVVLTVMAVNRYMGYRNMNGGKRYAGR